jgi:hypothetical protein
MTTKMLRIGPILPPDYEIAKGTCADCGGQCDGPDCGLHAEGCIFGGPPGGDYWLIAEGCPLDHAESTESP